MSGSRSSYGDDGRSAASPCALKGFGVVTYGQVALGARHLLTAGNSGTNDLRYRMLASCAGEVTVPPNKPLVSIGGSSRDGGVGSADNAFGLLVRLSLELE